MSSGLNPIPAAQTSAVLQEQQRQMAAVNQIVDASRPIKEVTLKNGWKLQVQEPGALDLWRISEILKGMDPRDPRNVYTLAIFSIVSINGQPFPKPSSEAEIKGFLIKLGSISNLQDLIEKVNDAVSPSESGKDELKKE